MDRSRKGGWGRGDGGREGALRCRWRAGCGARRCPLLADLEGWARARARVCG